MLGAAYVESLGADSREDREAAFRQLSALGDAVVPVIMQGLGHPNWRVRRGCAQFADRHPDPALLERLRLTVHDPKARVRAIAVHSLGCEHCKVGGNPLDPIPVLLQRLKHDKAIRVRRMAAATLVPFVAERRVARAFRRSLATESDVRLRRLLGWGIAHAAMQGSASHSI